MGSICGLAIAWPRRAGGSLGLSWWLPEFLHALGEDFVKECPTQAEPPFCRGAVR